VPRDDRRVKEAVGAIMEISKEMLALYGRIVWYVSSDWVEKEALLMGREEG